MINKFQQGGAAPQQGGGILAQIQQLPQEQQQQIMQAFGQWAQQKGIDPNSLQDPAALEQALGQFMQEMQQQQAQVAKHGAKLNYIKKLKHQCAEDEELKFFARGGNIDCGCVKKDQKGGKAEPKKSALQQFKDKKKAPVRTKAEQDSINKKSEEDYFNGTADHTKPGTRNIQLKKKECGGKMKKHQIGGQLTAVYQKAINNRPVLAPTQKPIFGWNIGKPTMKPNGVEETDINSLPDKFGRKVMISRQVSPSTSGPFRNDTTYSARIHTPSKIYVGQETNGRRVNGAAYVSPQQAIGRDYNSWGDYFKFLSNLK